ncbi:MAG: DUF1648 domain-containing protein [Lachnospiraceae bacterium]|nr:DUF1648 domain-containing protein [Lachnospiraceae bacterium]
MFEGNKFNIAVRFICSVLIVVTFVYVFAAWHDLPDRIPIHFDAAGEPNGYGSKYTMIIFPLIMLGMFIMMEVVARHPKSWNTGVKVTERNQEKVYKIIRNMLSYVELAITVLFTVISFMMAGVGSLGKAFLPVTLIAILGGTAVWLVKLFRVK